jgi:tRNA 5-methylaminomethyl-2-thiouridine biosynthesis bifunctional protein
MVPGGLDGLLAVQAGPQDGEGMAAHGLQDVSGYVQGLTQEQASRQAQVPLGGPALHFLQGGWVSPKSLVERALATPGVHFQGHAQVRALRALEGRERLWSVLDASGRPLAEAPLVVLAAGAGLPALGQALDAELSGLGPVSLTRGQLTWFHSPAPLQCPVTGHGYAVSLPDGRLLCGASQHPVQAPDQDDLVQEDEALNLARLHWLTGLGPAKGSVLGGRVSWRAHTPDRLPLIGPAPRLELALHNRQDQARFIPRHPGLFIIGALGSRGLLWAPLASRLLAAWLDATPMPLEADLVDALDPCRWWVRQSRRAGGTGRQAVTAGAGADQP